MLSRFGQFTSRRALRCAATPAPAQNRNFLASASMRIVDQTKKNNDSSQSSKEGHQNQATKAGSGQGDHPAKQADPQASPSKSTGVETDGPGSSEAGSGSESGVYKNEQLSKDQDKKEKEGGREGSMTRGAAEGESLAEGSYDSSGKARTSKGI